MQRDRAQEMVDVGSLARVDLKQLEAQVSQDEYTVVNNRTQLDNYRLQLKQLLELVGTDDFDVATPNTGDANVLSAIPPKEAVYASAYAFRPEIQSGKLSIEQSELDIDIARRGFYPSVSMSAGIGTSNNSGISTALTEQWRRNLNNSIGLTVSVPIFDNRQNRTNVRKAKLSKDAADLSLQDTEQQLYRQIETYWLNARNAQQQYVAAKANVESMQETYGLVSEQFRLGLKTSSNSPPGKTISCRPSSNSCSRSTQPSTTSPCCASTRANPSDFNFTKPKHHQRMKKNIAICALCLVAFGCSKAPKVTYTTETARLQNITTSITATGTIEPVTEVEVGTQVSGIIDRIYVDYNSIVHRGDVIAELDKTNLLSELASAQSNLANAQASLNYQTANYQRFKTLYDKGLISANEYESAKLSYEQARQQIVVNSKTCRRPRPTSVMPPSQRPSTASCWPRRWRKDRP